MHFGAHLVRGGLQALVIGLGVVAGLMIYDWINGGPDGGTANNAIP